MTDSFCLTARTDENTKRLYLTATGAMDSKRFVSDQIGFLEATGGHWKYDRIIDLTQCEGFVDYDEVVRLSEFCSLGARQAIHDIKVAVVTHNRLTLARLPMMELLFKRHVMRAFDNEADAEAWLEV